jgi:hypothetical protein
MTEPSLFDSDPEPIRHYTQDGEPSSGWSGTDTSKDAEPIRSEKQRITLNFTRLMGARGATVKEAREATGIHHGTVSSNMHALQEKNHVAMLTEKRENYHVYVITSLVGGREVVPFVDRPGRKELARAAFAAGHRAAWADLPRDATFDQWWEGLAVEPFGVVDVPVDGPLK